MKKFEVLQNLPFNIKKGDILTYNDLVGILLDSNNNEIPFDPIKETSFFKEYIEINGKFEIGSNVCLNKPMLCQNEVGFRSSINIPARTPLKVIKYIKPQKNKYVIVEFNCANFKIPEKDLMEYKEYYFINSSGHIHKDILGKHPEGDRFRKLTSNMFDTKEDAERKLDFILSPPSFKMIN
jgi:hypothetical protein